MAKTKKKDTQQQPAPKKERNPECLIIDERYCVAGDKERAKAALDAGGEAWAEHKDNFNNMLTARALTQPEVRAARVIQRYEGDKLDINFQADELRRQVAEAKGGNMDRAEAMLLAQAHTLDALFSSLAMRSHANMLEGYGEAADRYMRLALKAQTQCRATIETLGTLKNPPIVFARNANVVNGPQQVNQTIAGGSALPGTHAGNFETKPNELLEADHGERMDSGTQRTAGSLDQAMAAMGAINRAPNT